MTYLVIISGVISRILPKPCLIALLTAVIAVRAYASARRNAENIPELIPSMGMNVIINLLTPALLAVGLFLG